jgi:hypothetical protein
LLLNALLGYWFVATGVSLHLRGCRCHGHALAFPLLWRGNPAGRGDFGKKEGGAAAEGFQGGFDKNRATMKRINRRTGKQENMKTKNQTFSAEREYRIKLETLALLRQHQIGICGRTVFVFSADDRRCRAATTSSGSAALWKGHLTGSAWILSADGASRYYCFTTPSSTAGCSRAVMLTRPMLHWQKRRRREAMEECGIEGFGRWFRPCNFRSGCA